MEQLARRKKKGFTLIELIAVIAIIGILAAVLVPRVLGYMNDARDSETITQARNVRMAYETIISRDETVLTGGEGSVSVTDVITEAADASKNWGDYFAINADNTDRLNTGATMLDLSTAINTNNPGSIAP